MCQRPRDGWMPHSLSYLQPFKTETQSQDRPLTGHVARNPHLLLNRVPSGMTWAATSHLQLTSFSFFFFPSVPQVYGNLKNTER